jgi:hypothetical protein
MDSHITMSGKIVVGSHGLGVPDPDLVQRRAWEVATIQSHDFPTFTDWVEARRELHGRSLQAEYPAEIGESLRSFAASGIKAVISRDDSTLGEELVREGMEEAEHDRMLLARRDTERE